jgi:hypothetical protein
VIPRAREYGMAIVTRKVSDITGVEAPEKDFVSLVVRQHPKSDQHKMLDVLPNELVDLKEVTDMVVLEVRPLDGTVKEMYVKYTDFSKLVSDEAIQNAPGTRGRRPGYKPNGG